MDIAIRVSRESHAKKRQVGAIAVMEDRIISIGWNGTFSGHDNCCEYKEYSSGDEGGWLDPEEITTRWPYEELTPEGIIRRYTLKTKPEVIHAEANLLGKLAGCSESVRGATIYITYAPCLDCAKQLAVAKIKDVVYNEENHRVQGVEYLRSCGVPSYNFKQLN